MTLQQLLSTLKSTNVLATVIEDVTNTELITLKVGGYDSLDDGLEGRIVKEWKITSLVAITVILEELV